MESDSLQRYKRRKDILNGKDLEAIDTTNVSNEEVQKHLQPGSFDINEWHKQTVVEFHDNVQKDARGYLKVLDKMFEQEKGSAFLDMIGLNIFMKLDQKYGVGALDKDGGNVDTIHNVREGVWATDKEKDAYENRGEYNSAEYHSHEGYIETNRQGKSDQKNGTLKDYATGKKFKRNDKTNLDHVVAAKEVHDDPGRVLAGVNGPDLANQEANLAHTSETFNKSKGARSIKDVIENGAKGEHDEKRVRDKGQEARDKINSDVNKVYYLGINSEKDQGKPSFIKSCKNFISTDFAKNLGKTSVKMVLFSGL